MQHYFPLLICYLCSRVINSKANSAETQLVAPFNFSFSTILLISSPQCTSMHIKTFRNDPQPAGWWSTTNKPVCAVLCVPLSPLKPVDAQVRLKWKKVASYMITVHKYIIAWSHQWSITAMWTEWQILILSITVESVKLFRQSQKNRVCPQ